MDDIYIYLSSIQHTTATHRNLKLKREKNARTQRGEAKKQHFNKYG